MTEKKTSIQLSVATKARLDAIGGKKDTYDDIIRRLLDQADKKKKQ